MPRDVRYPGEHTENPASYWAVQGGSGWLNILVAQQDGGVIFGQSAEDDLIFLHAVLGNIILRNQDKPTLPLPERASGSVARHFKKG